MPVNNTVANGYIQLGVAGAALLIVLVLVVLVLQLQQIKMKQDGKMNDNIMKMQFSKLDKLCDKIDILVSSNAEYTNKLNAVLLSNDKDQKELITILYAMQDSISDIKTRVVRVDDRTYKCIGLPPKKRGETNDN